MKTGKEKEKLMAIEERMEEGKKWRSIKVREEMTSNIITTLKKITAK